MAEEFDYTPVSSQYVHCFNAACPRAGKCLRQLVASQVTTRLKVILTVNPAVWPVNEAEAQCAYFLSMKPIRLAWGMRNTLNRMPSQQDQNIIRALNRMYSCSALHGMRARNTSPRASAD